MGKVEGRVVYQEERRKEFHMHEKWCQGTDNIKLALRKLESRRLQAEESILVFKKYCSIFCLIHCVKISFKQVIIIKKYLLFMYVFSFD